MRLLATRDLYAGLLFIGFGLGTVLVARTYPMGSAARMGPGYFPTVVGGLLVLLGLVIAVRAARPAAAPLGRFAPRPLALLLAAVVAFGLLIQSLGLVCALLGLLVLGCLASPEPRLADMAVLFVVLAVLASGLFVYVLGLPLKVWPV